MPNRCTATMLRQIQHHQWKEKEGVADGLHGSSDILLYYPRPRAIHKISLAPDHGVHKCYPGTGSSSPAISSFRSVRPVGKALYEIKGYDLSEHEIPSLFPSRVWR